jgi:hypothetical protein
MHGPVLHAGVSADVVTVTTDGLRGMAHSVQIIAQAIEWVREKRNE